MPLSFVRVFNIVKLLLFELKKYFSSLLNRNSSPISKLLLKSQLTISGELAFTGHVKIAIEDWSTNKVLSVSIISG